MKSRYLTGVVALAVLLFTTGVSIEAANRGKGRGGGKKSTTTISGKQMTCSPTEAVSPIVSETNMRVCVTGFEPGNFVTIGVPWVGTTSSHSMLSFSSYIDDSGGFCISAPPGWTEMNLQPGTYTIKSAWYTSGSSSHRSSGPNTTFEVMGN